MEDKKKELIMKLLDVLFDTDIDYIINDKKYENCTMTEINTKEDKVYFRHDYWESVKYLIKGRIGCYLDISEIKSLEINTKENICKIIYEEDEL
jgi:hypothetical protein